jgi:hypothetical protein
MPQLSDETIHNARRNDYGKTFEFGGKTFELKDLSYDDYVEFVKLAGPLVENVVSVIQPVLQQDEKGELIKDFSISLQGLDISGLADLAGNNLPRMAHIVCRTSDPEITVDEVKRLSMKRVSKDKPIGPFAMIEVVLKQVAHNKMIDEFVSFFPRLGSLVSDLAPAMAGATPQSTTEATRT